MASRIHSLDVFSDGSVSLIPPSSSVLLYEMWLAGNPRQAAIERGQALPDIINLHEGGSQVVMTEAWQNYLVDTNPNMTKKNIAALFGTHKMLANNTGFPTNESEPRRANYITGEDLNYPPPELDKVRTFSKNVHSGRVAGNELVLTMFDGRLPPPSIFEVNPLTHRHLFCVCTEVTPSGTIRSIVNGAPSWGIAQNVVWFPLVSNYEIRVPLAMVKPVTEWRLPFS